MIGNIILILSAHTDDGEISAGGTVAKAVDEGKEVYYTAFSSCEKSVADCYPQDILKKECIEATYSLGIPKKNTILLDFEVREFPRSRQDILDSMIKLNRDIHPDLIICPSSFDTHQDHQVIYQETLRAFKKTASILGAEEPWNNLDFLSNIFVRLDEKHVQKKLEALSKYQSQASKDYFTEEYTRAHMLTRGMNIGARYAEVFECIRLNM
jgi:LmbE family N-acetylglucosaminyl deacetylase